MLMAARSSGSPPWTRRPLPRPVGRSSATLRAIAGFMASSGPKSGASSGSAGLGSDAEATEDEWEASETMEEEEEEEEEDEEGVAFRDAEFRDEDEEESEYEPSEDEEDESLDAAVEEDDRSVAGLFAKYLPRRPRSANPARLRSLNLQKSGKASSDSDDGAFGEQDAVLWEDEDDKRRWVSRYHAADRAFRNAFGCSIDSQAQPEVKRRLAEERTRRPVYTLLVVALLVMYASQLSGISLSAALSATSTAGHTIASLLTESTVSFTQPREAEEIANDVRYSEEAAAHHLTASIEDEFVSESSTQADTSTAEYVKAANDLCGQLLYRVVMSGREAKVTNNAESACDISVKLAPFGSLDAAVAHTQRGDLRSVLGQFQGADDDYTVAELGLLSASANFDEGDILPAMQEAVRGKSIANYWIQLYIARDVEMLVQQVTEMSGEPNPSELAAAWMRVFRGELSVLEGLTLLRLRTLRRLSESVPVPAQ